MHHAVAATERQQRVEPVGGVGARWSRSQKVWVAGGVGARWSRSQNLKVWVVGGVGAVQPGDRVPAYSGWSVVVGEVCRSRWSQSEPQKLWVVEVARQSPQGVAVQCPLQVLRRLRPRTRSYSWRSCTIDSRGQTRVGEAGGGVVLCV